MKHKEIKITLQKHEVMSEESYTICKLVGAITVATRKHADLTVGSRLTRAEAGELVPFYSVTVIQ